VTTTHKIDLQSAIVRKYLRYCATDPTNSLTTGCGQVNIRGRELVWKYWTRILHPRWTMQWSRSNRGQSYWL